MGIQVKLTEDEVVRAIFDYIDSNYHNMYGEKLTMHYARGRLQGVTVDCELKKRTRKGD